MYREFTLYSEQSVIESNNIYRFVIPAELADIQIKKLKISVDLPTDFLDISAGQTFYIDLNGVPTNFTFPSGVRTAIEIQNFINNAFSSVAGSWANCSWNENDKKFDVYNQLPLGDTRGISFINTGALNTFPINRFTASSIGNYIETTGSRNYIRKKLTLRSNDLKLPYGVLNNNTVIATVNDGVVRGESEYFEIDRLTNSISFFFTFANEQTRITPERFTITLQVHT